MRCKILFTYWFFFSFFAFAIAQPKNNPLLEKGWAALVKDNETDAYRAFSAAYEKAKEENNIHDKANSLLYLGICSFGASREKGLHYATQALEEFKKLETTNLEEAKIGRSKCLQLISTIFIRQKKYEKAMELSRDVVNTLKTSNDTSGTLGLAYSSIGSLFEQKKQPDSAVFYYKMALLKFEKDKNLAYIPNTYYKLGEFAQQKGDISGSLIFFNKALSIATTTENKQAIVNSYIGLGKWHETKKDIETAENYYTKAHKMASQLSDKSFEIKALEALIGIKKLQKDFYNVSQLQSQVLKIKDTFYSIEREQIVKNLEVQFEVSENTRKLELVSKEKEVSKLTNLLLLILLAVLLSVFGIVYYFLKRINKRDKQLLQTNEELVSALEVQKKFKEVQFQNDIEHKESQLSAITLQMLQKNELLEEIKTTVEAKSPNLEKQVLKIVNKYHMQDNNWSDFDNYFESVNKNFYTRLKQNYPDISSNDLKICALIKLNLSIKEMASILNISPDSVKTARYRLRKKLQLTTEENLTDFILSI